jgi:hypothetical protein
MDKNAFGVGFVGLPSQGKKKKKKKKKKNICMEA